MGMLLGLLQVSGLRYDIVWGLSEVGKFRARYSGPHFGLVFSINDFWYIHDNSSTIALVFYFTYIKIGLLWVDITIMLRERRSKPKRRCFWFIGNFRLVRLYVLG
jgi:hypothetical protein